MSQQVTRINDRISVRASGHREFADGAHMVKECVVTPPIDDPGEETLMDDWYEPGREKHSSQTADLFEGEETLLYDTLTPAGTGIVLDALSDLVDELDYLVVSHPEANHAGNAPEILEAYPEATLVVPGRGSHHDLHGLADLEGVDVRFAEHGDTIDLGGRTVEFVEEVFFDHAMTIWLFDRETRTLCTSDFMGFEHMDGECLALADELDNGGPTDDQLERFNGYAFTWFRFVDPETTDAALDRVIETYDPAILAPAHGQVIREDAAGYLEAMKDIIRTITDKETEDPSVHTHQMLRYTQ